ncbi:hypothetical protein ACOSQ3_013107 [Xanthoceras sorbifolium]
MTGKRRSKKLCKYLKPGALAKIRDTKNAAARSQRTGLLTISMSPTVTEPPCLPSVETLPNDQMENIPCFALRTNKGPECLLTKRLVAVTPVFLLSNDG